MIAKIAGAMAGKYFAGRNSGLKGAALGAGAAALARRGFWPLAAGAAVAYGAKKLYERRRSKPSYPSEAAPASSSGRSASSK